MRVDLRKHKRFADFGKVSCAELCPVSGVLDNISIDGCNVHFDAPVLLSFENDYELRVRFSRFSMEELVLVCHPEWSREDDEHEGTTEIGFSILRSPDTARLETYVMQLQAEQQELNETQPAQEDDPCLFV